MLVWVKKGKSKLYILKWNKGNSLWRERFMFLTNDPYSWSHMNILRIIVCGTSTRCPNWSSNTITAQMCFKSGIKLVKRDHVRNLFVNANQLQRFQYLIYLFQSLKMICRRLVECGDYCSVLKLICKKELCPKPPNCSIYFT